ncbi:MAG: CRISPR-associated protein Cas4 [Planctomycetaceae bacterium]
MHAEDDFLPISALQHLLFCERQTALIHIERLWEENRFTAEGRVLHQKADAAKSETRDGVRITRGLPVHSFALNVFGVCDVVLFKPPEFETESKMSLPKRIEEQIAFARTAPGPFGSSHIEFPTRPSVSTHPPRPVPPFQHWHITPVEYKRGKPKTNDCDRVQLCAQAMCLEEMLQINIRRGDLFYGKQRRCTEVLFDEKLRATTQQTADRLHALIRRQRTPAAVREQKCDTCSLLPLCMPPSSKRSLASDYLAKILTE